MPTVYGPLLPNYPKPKSRMDLSVGDFVYSLIAGGPKGPKTWPYDPGMSAWFIDVRDAAKAVRPRFRVSFRRLSLHLHYPSSSTFWL